MLQQELIDREEQLAKTYQHGKGSQRKAKLALEKLDQQFRGHQKTLKELQQAEKLSLMADDPAVNAKQSHVLGKMPSKGSLERADSKELDRREGSKTEERREGQ